MFVALGACAFVLIPVEYFLFGLAGGKLMKRVRSLTFQSLMRQEISWFDKPGHSRCVGFFYFHHFFSKQSKFNLFSKFDVDKLARLADIYSDDFSFDDCKTIKD
jgi:hypothetical protein